MIADICNIFMNSKFNFFDIHQWLQVRAYKDMVIYKGYNYNIYRNWSVSCQGTVEEP